MVYQFSSQVFPSQVRINIPRRMPSFLAPTWEFLVHFLIMVMSGISEKSMGMFQERPSVAKLKLFMPLNYLFNYLKPFEKPLLQKPNV